MTRKGRAWIGITALFVIAFNYIVIGLPMIKREATIKDQTKAILIKQVKSGTIFKVNQDEYMLDIFRREKASLDKRLLILNSVTATAAIIVISWTVFGVISQKKR